MATQRNSKSKVSGQAVMGEIKTLAMLTGGVVLGSVGEKMIDKVLKVDAAATGFNAKALARPLVLLGVGAAGNLMLKDQNMKLVAPPYGMSPIDFDRLEVSVLQKDVLSNTPCKEADFG